MNNTNKSLVSIIIAVYNIEKFIGACLESILNQTYNNWEAIVVNDGSTDSSLEICESFAKRDSRFKVITTKNGGSSNARNYGLDNVKGNYVMMVDGDDMLMPDAIKTSVEQLLSLDVDILCTSAVCITEDGNKVLRTSHQMLSNRMDAMTTIKMIHSGQMIAGIWAKIYKKECLKDVRFNLKLRMAQDVFFNDELLLGHPEIMVAITNDITYKYRIRSSSVSHHRQASNRLRPYIEAMSFLIPLYSGKRDVTTLSLMSNSVFGILVRNIIIKEPFYRRFPNDWSLDIIGRLIPYITDHRYLKLSRTPSNKMGYIIRYTIYKYSIIIAKYTSMIKKGLNYLCNKTN